MSKIIIKIIVNSITTLRLIFAILLMILLNYISNYTFLICMVILFLTDFIDGFLARKFMVQSLYGSIMDTFADKVLNIALILPLLKSLPFILAVLLLEVIIMLINTTGKISGKNVTTTYIGKIKMWVVALMLILGYLNLFNIINLDMVIPIIFTIIIQIIVMIDYVISLAKQGNIEKNFIYNNKKDLLYKMFDTEYYLSNLNSEEVKKKNKES